MDATDFKGARACAYARVSTSIQADKHSTEVQRASIDRWLMAHGLTAEFFEDLALSGKTMERPGLRAMLAAVDQGRFDTVVCYSLTRLGRNTKDLLNVVEHLRAKGVRLVLLKENVDLGTPMGRFFLTVLSAIAELEREITAERVRDAVRTHIGAGMKWGGARVPVGSVGGPKHPPEFYRDLHGRWRRGEPLKALAREAGVTPGALKARFRRLGTT